MAMTLRLDEQETEARRKRADREGRSMQDVARQAVRDYIERTSKRELLDAVLDRELPRYSEALERLGQLSSSTSRPCSTSRTAPPAGPSRPVTSACSNRRRLGREPRHSVRTHI